jgi:hypothetical protein
MFRIVSIGYYQGLELTILCKLKSIGTRIISIQYDTSFLLKPDCPILDQVKQIAGKTPYEEPGVIGCKLHSPPAIEAGQQGCQPDSPLKPSAAVQPPPKRRIDHEAPPGIT